jgi:hypothetical protein
MLTVYFYTKQAMERDSFRAEFLNHRLNAGPLFAVIVFSDITEFGLRSKRNADNGFRAIGEQFAFVYKVVR